MYIPQVVIGIVGTIFVEAVGLIVFSIVWREKDGKNNDNQSNQ